MGKLFDAIAGRKVWDGMPRQGGLFGENGKISDVLTKENIDAFGDAYQPTLGVLNVARGIGESNANAGTSAYINRLQRDTDRERLETSRSLMEAGLQSGNRQMATRLGGESSSMLSLIERLRNRKATSSDALASQSIV